MTEQPTFAVCAMVREDPEVLVQFADYYRAIGASEILLYYDGTPPDDPRLSRPGLMLVACDAAFWAKRPEGTRPRSVDVAQGACFDAARRASVADWLFVTDADEFLIPPVPVGDLLARVPEGIDAVRVQTAEAVWGPGDDPDLNFGCTYFRRPIRPRLARILEPLLYGRASVFYRKGLIGHAAGKHFVRRTGDVTRIGNHNSYRGATPVGVWAWRIDPIGREFHVAHFDSVGFDRWCEKWRRRYSAETDTEKMHAVRHAQKARVEAAARGGEAELHRLFRQLNVLAPWQVAILRSGGFVFRRQIFDDHERPA